MRDDTVTPPERPESKPRFSLKQRFSEIPWRNALSGRWWWRWFRKSLIQSGRLTTLLGLILLMGVQLEDPGVLRLIRARVFDFYQQTHPRTLTEDSPVVVIDIDEKSLAEQGQFPWPRTVQGEIIKKATEAGVAVVGFDVMWPEEDQTSISKVIMRVPSGVVDPATRARLEKTPTNDDLLAQDIAASGRVVLGLNSVSEKPAGKAEDEESLTSFAKLGDDPMRYLERTAGVLQPLPVLNRAAAGRGLVSLSTQFFDGIVRQVPTVVSAGGDLYPSLALEMLRVKLGAKTIAVSTDKDLGGITQIAMRPAKTKERYVVKTDGGGQVWIYFREHESFQNSYISATDLINGRIPPEKLAGKLALVGTSASGLFDLRSTPLDPVLPGVEVHANLLENIIFKTQLIRPSQAYLIEWATTFVVGLIMIIVAPMVSAGVGVTLLAAIAGGLGWYSWDAFSTRLELYDPTFPVAVAFLFYSVLTYASYSREAAQRKQVRTAFGQYLSPALVQKLAEDPSKLTLGGENREMTFMFSDVRGFTAISELFDAQGLTKLINRLLTPLTNAILSTSGTIDKYMGDCVMAFWNAPLDVKDHAAAACRASLKMIEAVQGVNKVLEAEAIQEGREHRPLAVGIGINSGIACVGNMGSEQRFDYSVLGDNVNLASRLEGQSKSYGITIVVGENSAKYVPEFALLEMDLIQVKGKKQAVRIFTLAGDPAVAATPAFADLRRHHDAALAAYRGQRWDEAEAEIAECLAITNTQSGLVAELVGFYDVLSERIADFRAHPPGADWDGVYVATSK